MAKAAKRKKVKKVDVLANYIRPTPEREAHNDFTSAGPAVRVIPVIDQLKRDGFLSTEEHDALSYYRDQASIAERSPMRSCLDDTVRGTSVGGPGVTILSAQIESGRIERGMGGLWHLCRAVCVDDWTLARWARERGGSVALALLELKYAAGGVIPRRG